MFLDFTSNFLYGHWICKIFDGKYLPVDFVRECDRERVGVYRGASIPGDETDQQRRTVTAQRLPHSHVITQSGPMVGSQLLWDRL